MHLRRATEQVARFVFGVQIQRANDYFSPAESFWAE
jgi:hypothetical protein